MYILCFTLLIGHTLLAGRLRVMRQRSLYCTAQYHITENCSHNTYSEDNQTSETYTFV
jgi:hypothetical protein